MNRVPNSTQIRCEDEGEIHRGVEIRGSLHVGRGARIGPDCQLKGDVKVSRGTNLVEKVDVRGEVEFGNYCAVARGSVFQAMNHPLDYPSIQTRLYDDVLETDLPLSGERIEVGSDVWVETRSIVLPGIKIGHGAVIGAGSVVTTDIEPYSVVAGVPAEHKRWRFGEAEREAFLNMQWWEWSEDRLRENVELLDQPFTTK